MSILCWDWPASFILGAPITLSSPRVISTNFQDEYSEVVEEWNSIREKATRMAIDEMLLPFLENELEQKLLEEAKTSVITVS